MKLGRKDQVGYADENGVVTWDYVKTYVTEVLNEYESSRS